MVNIEAGASPRKRPRMGSATSIEPTPMKTANGDGDKTPTKDERNDIIESPDGKASPGVSDDGIDPNASPADSSADLPESPRREELPPSTFFYDPELVMHICEWPTASLEAQVS